MRPQKEIQLVDFPFPDSTDQERLVLADMIVSAGMADEIISLVHADFFTTEERRKVWETMKARHERGESLDAQSIIPVLGPAFGAEVAPQIANAVGTIAALEHAANLRNTAAKRRAYIAATAFLQSSLNPSSDEQSIFTSVEAFSKAVEGPAPLQGEKALKDVLVEVRAQTVKTQEAAAAGKTLRVTTGFKYMDEVLNGGFKPGQLVILAARPSVGKTALMLQMAKSAALAGNPVQVFSLEMQAGELAERLLFSTGEVRPYHINFGQVEWPAYDRAEAQLAPLPLYINDFSRSLDEIVSHLTLAVKKGRCKVVYIDYLGLMQDALNFGHLQLYQAIAKITGTLKAAAKRLDIPVVLLCQMNREAAKEKRAPELFDLRDSGSIEQDADVVFMLESKMATEKRLIVWLRKNRAGKKEVGFVLVPNDTYSAFEEGLPVDQLTEPSVPVTLPQPVPETFEEEEVRDDLPF